MPAWEERDLYREIGQFLSKQKNIINCSTIVEVNQIDRIQLAEEFYQSKTYGNKYPINYKNELINEINHDQFILQVAIKLDYILPKDFKRNWHLKNGFSISKRAQVVINFNEPIMEGVKYQFEENRIKALTEYEIGLNRLQILSERDL